MRRWMMIALFLGPFRLAAYVTACRPANDGPTGPAAGQVEVVLSGSTLRLQNQGFIESGLPTLGTPSVSVSEGTINVTQSYAPPPIPGVLPYQMVCQVEEVSVGSLPPGTYKVVWTYVTPTGPAVVGGLVRTSGVNPCTTTPAYGRPNVSVTLMPEGITRLHIEATDHGYQPVYGTPAVTAISPTEITVEQPLTDVADPLSAAPTATVCHAEDVDLSSLSPGAYVVTWNYNATFAGMPAKRSDGVAMVWSGTSLQCSTNGVLSTIPAVPADDAPVTLQLSRAVEVQYGAGASLKSINAATNGRDITVDEQRDWSLGGGSPEGGPEPVLRCSSLSVTVPALAHGNYMLHWHRGTDVTAGSFTVFHERRRSARR